MKLQAKTHLLLSELEFVAGGVKPGTVIWCIAKEGKLAVAARDGSLTVRSIVPLVGSENQSAVFGVNGLAFLNVARLGGHKTTSIELNGMVKLNNGTVSPVIGMAPSWVFDTDTAKPSVALNWKSLQGSISSAAKLISKCEHGNYSGEGVGIRVSKGRIRTLAMDSHYLYEHSQPLAYSSENFEAFVTKQCLTAVQAIGFAPTSPVAIGASPEATEFRCGPRLVRVANTGKQVLSIEDMAPPEKMLRSCATSASELRGTLSRMSIAMHNVSNVVDVEVLNGTIRLSPPFLNDAFDEAEEHLSCQYWEPLFARLNCHTLLKLMASADGALVVSSTQEKPIIMFEGRRQRFLISKIK